MTNLESGLQMLDVINRGYEGENWAGAVLVELERLRSELATVEPTTRLSSPKSEIDDAQQCATIQQNDGEDVTPT